MLALRPDLVDLRREADNWPSGRWAGETFPDKSGRTPSAELGERIIANQVARLSDIGRQLLAAYSSTPGWQAPSLTDVEDIWHRFEHLTRKYWWCSLTLDEFLEGRHGAFPGWEALGE